MQAVLVATAVFAACWHNLVRDYSEGSLQTFASRSPGKQLCFLPWAPPLRGRLRLLASHRAFLLPLLPVLQALWSATLRVKALLQALLLQAAF